MSNGTLYDKVWERHKVKTLPNGQDQLFIGLHLIHEVTSPQALSMLRERGLEVAYPGLTHATMDHIIPTADHDRPYTDEEAEAMMAALERNMAELPDIEFHDFESGEQGIVHVIGPELGLTQPGTTVVCGDSHTSTHGAFGALAFGIGTSQMRDVFATQTLAMDKLDVRRIEVEGELGEGVTAKDVILTIIRELGVDGGVGYVYEYAGEAIESLDMEGRMSICNMSIEGGARAGYVNPDETTYEWLNGRKYVPDGEAFEEREAYWESIRSDPDADYDDIVTFDASEIEPMVTWGTTPGQGIGITEPIPELSELPEDKREPAERGMTHMGVEPGQTMEGYPIDVAFIGSCTNARLRDLRAAAEIVEGRQVHESVRGLVVPGSQQVKAAAEADGLDEVFKDAGFEWRHAGCSMCLGMNEDQLKAGQTSASSSNRNFVGRQGSKDGRTVLMSPTMVAAAAVTGEVTDVRDLQKGVTVA